MKTFLNKGGNPMPRREAVLALVGGAAALTLQAADNSKSQQLQPRSENPKLFLPSFSEIEKPNTEELPPEANGSLEEQTSTAWDNVYKELFKHAGLEMPKPDEFAAALKPISTNFKPYVMQGQPDFAFRHRHVEILLDQAADLLERGLRTKSEWEDIAGKAFSLASELVDFYKNEEVLEKQIAQDLFSLPYLASRADAVSAKLIGTSHEAALTTINKFFGDYFSQEQFNDQLEAAKMLAWYSGYPVFRKDVAIGGEFPYTGGAKPVLDRDNTAKLTTHAFAVQKFMFSRDIAVLDVAAKSYSALQESKEKQASYDKANIEFQRIKAKNARDHALTKLQALTEADGVFNYVERLSPLQDRFNRDFQDAILRVKFAMKGLTEVYAYKAELPETVKQVIALYDDTNKPLNGDFPKVASSSFDDCLRWVRDAITWIVGFSRLDQNYTKTISLRGKLDSNAFDAGKKQFSWDFAIKPDDFAGQTHVRLRGLSAFVEARNGKGLWQVTISSIDNKIDCRLGRVGSRSGPRDPDVTGVLQLHNCSPFGKWRILLSEITSDSAGSFEDAHLDLLVAAQST